MTSIWILLALGSLSGFVIGISHFSWLATLAAGAVLAPLSAVVLQNQGFDALPGISVIVACLAINQAAYVIGASVNGGPRSGPVQRANDVPHDGRDDDVRREHKREQNTRFKLAQLTNQRQTDLTPISRDERGTRPASRIVVVVRLAFA
jgi:hypothetical protein